MIINKKVRFKPWWLRWVLFGRNLFLITPRIMVTTNLTGDGTQTFIELLCSPSLVGKLQLQLISFLAAVNILLSITAFLGNSLILFALHKESSLHPPSKLLYRCLATTDLLVGLVSQPLWATHLLSLVHEHWSLCRYARDVGFFTVNLLCSMSLCTMTTISVDRVLALILGLRYRQTVNLRRTFITVAYMWILCLAATLCLIFDYRITIWYSLIGIPSCLVVSVASYTYIFCTLNQHHAQVQDHVQQQPSQPNVLNIARYRKAVHSALWVQLALVVCYLPYGTVIIVITKSKTYSSHLIAISGIAGTLVCFNSTLNPFLYCWRISEVRQAVKQSIRQILCCPWS